MAYALIGREDIAATLASNSSTAAATCTTGISVSKKDLSNQDLPKKQQQQFEPGAAIHVQRQGQRVQHLLLPYEQRLLLPSGSFLTGQQHHQRLPSAAAGNAAATANPRIAVPRGPAARGLRSTGAAAGSSTAATAAAGGSSGAAATAGNGGGQGGEVVPVDGMEGLVNGVSALRFSRDDRLAEARSLLGTNMPVLLAVSHCLLARLCLLTNHAPLSCAQCFCVPWCLPSPLMWVAVSVERVKTSTPECRSLHDFSQAYGKLDG